MRACIVLRPRHTTTGTRSSVTLRARVKASSSWTQRAGAPGVLCEGRGVEGNGGVWWERKIKDKEVGYNVFFYKASFRSGLFWKAAVIGCGILSRGGFRVALEGGGESGG